MHVCLSGADLKEMAAGSRVPELCQGRGELVDKEKRGAALSARRSESETNLWSI